MSDTLEPKDHSIPDDVGDVENRFEPRWSRCTGLFDATSGNSSRENEELHYRKHAVIGREWGCELSLAEYRMQALAHLNSVDTNCVIELCQIEDLAVVKYNVQSGDLGIARADDGAVKTFFRPNDVAYVLRKVDAGSWGEPGLADGFEFNDASRSLTDDPQVAYLMARLEILAAELPGYAERVVMDFAEGTAPTDGILALLGRLGEYRFCIFEVQRHILTEAQHTIVFGFRKKIIGAVASLEALERYRREELSRVIGTAIESGIATQFATWSQAQTVIDDIDAFDQALNRRQLLAYAMLELRILQLHRRVLDLDLFLYDQTLRRADICLRSVFYQLATRFKHRNNDPIAPEDFFWHRMARNIG